MKAESPNKYFSGFVELPDFLTIPQVRIFEDSLGDPSIMQENADDTRRVWLSVADEKMIPAILACTKDWSIAHIDGRPTAETFPGTPRRDSHELIMWLYNEIAKLWNAESVPNG